MSPHLSRFRRRVRLARALPHAVVVGLAAFSATLSWSAPLGAQGPVAVVTGAALAVKDGKPIPFTLVTLGNASASGVALTGADGHFRFGVVPPGDYRLRLERPGFRTDSGVPVHVAAGDSLGFTLHDTQEPLVVPRSDTAGGVCYPGSMLERKPALAALWGEALKPARARRALDLSYSYRVNVTERIVRYYIRRVSHRLQSTPALARALAEGGGGYAGYGVGMDSTRLVAVSEMLEVLSDDFLRTNCLKALPDRGGERRLRFQPMVSDPARTELIGNVVLDQRLVLKRIEFEYRKGGNATARGVVKYGDGGLSGGEPRFVSFLDVVTLDDEPQTEGEVIDVDTRWRQRSSVWVSYGKFLPDSTELRP